MANRNTNKNKSNGRGCGSGCAGGCTSGCTHAMVIGGSGGSVNCTPTTHPYEGVDDSMPTRNVSPVLTDENCGLFPTTGARTSIMRTYPAPASSLATAAFHLMTSSVAFAQGVAQQVFNFGDTVKDFTAPDDTQRVGALGVRMSSQGGDTGVTYPFIVTLSGVDSKGNPVSQSFPVKAVGGDGQSGNMSLVASDVEGQLIEPIVFTINAAGYDAGGDFVAGPARVLRMTVSPAVPTGLSLSAEAITIGIDGFIKVATDVGFAPEHFGIFGGAN